MPQANSIPFETANLDLISDRPRKVPEYRFPALSHTQRDRTYSLPTRPRDTSHNRPHSFQRNPSQQSSDEDDDHNNTKHTIASREDDPLARMRVNLERSTFLLSRLKVGLSSKPEVIEIKPPLGSSDSSWDMDFGYSASGYEYDDKSPHRSSSAKPPSSKGKGRVPPTAYRIAAPSTLDRVDSTQSSNTQFSLEVSNYEYLGPPAEEDHGSEFHQLVNHGRLYNPSRGGAPGGRPRAMSSAMVPPPRSSGPSNGGGSSSARSTPTKIVSRPMTMLPFPPPTPAPKDVGHPHLVEGRYGPVPKPNQTRHGSGHQHPGPSPLGYEGDRRPRYDSAQSTSSSSHPPRSRTMSSASTSAKPSAYPHPPGLGSSSTHREGGRGHGHGRSVSVSHVTPSSSAARKPSTATAPTGLRRVRFEM